MGISVCRRVSARKTTASRGLIARPCCSALHCCVLPPRTRSRTCWSHAHSSQCSFRCSVTREAALHDGPLKLFRSRLLRVNCNWMENTPVNAEWSCVSIFAPCTFRNTSIYDAFQLQLLQEHCCTAVRRLPGSKRQSRIWSDFLAFEACVKRHGGNVGAGKCLTQPERHGLNEFNERRY